MVVNSIGTRLRLTYILLAIGPLLVVGLVLTGLSYFVQREQALNVQQEIARRVGAQVAGFIQNLENELLVAGRVASVIDLPSVDQENLLARLRANQSAFVDLYLVDQSGTELVHESYLQIATEADVINWPEEDAFQRPLTTQKTYFGPIYFSQTNEPQITVAIPLIDKRTAQPEAILIAEVRFKEIWDLIAGIDVSDGESVYILNSAGVVVAHRNPSIVLRGTTFALPEEDGIGPGLDVETAVVATVPLTFGEQALIVVAEKSVSQALMLAINTVWVILGVTLASLIFALALSLIATQQMVQPIRALANLAAAVRQGDLSQRAKRGGLNELDDLAFTFNQMSGQLQETLGGLEQLVEVRTNALKNSAEVSRYLSTILEQDQLLAQVVARLQTDFGFFLSNIYLINAQGDLESVSANGQDDAQRNDERARGLAAVSANEPTITTVSFHAGTFSHLAMPIFRGQTIVGVLNVYKQGKDAIAQQDADLVQSIANQLGVALQNAQSFAQLLQEKLLEAQRKEAAERRLEAYRTSPIGRAEQLATQLLAVPSQSFLMLYELVHSAELTPENRAALENLPQALAAFSQKLSEEEQRYSVALQNLAEGFYFLISSRQTLELLPVGLRTITTNLAKSEVAHWNGVASVFTVYEWCLSALEADTIEQISLLSFRPLTELDTNTAAELTTTLLALETVQKTSSIYLRVHDARDKIAYLVTAVEQLRRIERTNRQSQLAVDHNIFERITEQWLTVITAAMSTLQTQARIVCDLITRHTWHQDLVTLTLAIRNNGRGTALNVRVHLVSSEYYTGLDSEKQLKGLAPGEEKEVTVRLRPQLNGETTQFRVLFEIQYVDSRGTGQIEQYANIVHLMKADAPFQYIPNPYIVGTPLDAESNLFYGRQALFRAIKEDLSATHRHNLVLIGQRRMGKTSLLKQLQTRLDNHIVPVYLDGQVMALDPGMAGFFLNIATEITFALEDRGIEIPLPLLAEFEQSPSIHFERQFLSAVMQKIDGRHLLILFDEFEELENAVRLGNLDRTVFNYLRHLMQHYSTLSFIFCGTHRLEELAADYWSILFNISLYHHVGSLSKEVAYQLIQDPVRPFGMRYDDLSLEKMWRLTSGHPYFLQLLCHSLVNRHNRREQIYMTIADINATLDEILTSGEAHFIYLWNESTPEEKLTLFALGRMMSLTSRVSAIQVADFWAERGKTVEIQAIRQALHRLRLREIVTAVDLSEFEGDAQYRWQLGLLGLWVEKYKSTSRVWDEVQS